MKSWIGCVLGCEFPKLYCFIIFVHLWAVFKNISETKSLSSAMWILQLYSGIAIFWPALWSLGLSWHIGCHCLTDGDKTCHWFDTRWQTRPPKTWHTLTTSWQSPDWVAPETCVVVIVLLMKATTFRGGGWHGASTPAPNQSVSGD